KREASGRLVMRSLWPRSAALSSLRVPAADDLIRPRLGPTVFTRSMDDSGESSAAGGAQAFSCSPVNIGDAVPGMLAPVGRWQSSSCFGEGRERVDSPRGIS